MSQHINKLYCDFIREIIVDKKKMTWYELASGNIHYYCDINENIVLWFKCADEYGHNYFTIVGDEMVENKDDFYDSPELFREQFQSEFGIWFSNNGLNKELSKKAHEIKVELIKI